MWQEIIVGIVVAVAAVSLLWRYLPVRWRQRAGKVHPALAPTRGGCGGCSACGEDDGCSDTRRSV